MGLCWLCYLVAACCTLASDDNVNKNGSNVSGQQQALDKIIAILWELNNQSDVTFNGNEKVLSDVLPLVTFGKVFDYYDKLLEVSLNIQKLEKEKRKITKPLDEEIEKLNTAIDNIVQLCDPSIRKLAYILSGEQSEVDQLVDELNNEDTLKTVKSKFPQLTAEHLNRWKLLVKLNKSVEALKQQHGYGNFLYMDKVESYLIEYDKARKLEYCKEYIAKALESMKSDNYEVIKFVALLSPTGVNTMNLEGLKKELRECNESEYGKYLLHQIRALRYLNDFAVNELDKFGDIYANQSSFDVINILCQEKKEKRKADVIAKIMHRLAQIRNGTDSDSEIETDSDGNCAFRDKHRFRNGYARPYRYVTDTDTDSEEETHSARYTVRGN